MVTKFEMGKLHLYADTNYPYNFIFRAEKQNDAYKDAVVCKLARVISGAKPANSFNLFAPIGHEYEEFST